MYNPGLNSRISAKDFGVDVVFSFEDANNIDDEPIIYAISAPNHYIKGFLLTAFGIDKVVLSTEMVEKLSYTSELNS